MKVITFFTSGGIPAENLTPKITIREVSSKSIIINNQLMEEIGDGFYMYSFNDYKEGRTYAVLINGGDQLATGEKYSYGIIQDIDINSAISFIKNIEGGKWEITDNKMVFYAEDNKTEIAKFSLYNKDNQPSMFDVTKRIRYYEPTSGYIVFKFDNLSNFDNIMLNLHEGLYTLNLTIDQFPINIQIPVLATHTLDQLLSNIQIAIRNATQKQETVYREGNNIIIKSSTKGYNSEISNYSGTLINNIFTLLGIKIEETEIVKGYGEQGPI